MAGNGCRGLLHEDILLPIPGYKRLKILHPIALVVDARRACGGHCQSLFDGGQRLLSRERPEQSRHFPFGDDCRDCLVGEFFHGEIHARYYITSVEWRRRLLRMRDDSENAVDVICDEKIEPVIPVHASLPHVIGAAVFLGIERGMTNIVPQEIELLIHLFA